jgi:hypothetical protein
MNKKKLEQIIGEVLKDYKPKKKEDCGCGCNTCHLESKISLNESLTKKPTISEGLQYHLDNKLPLHESVYRTGSDKYFTLLREARRLYSRNILDVTGDDIELLRDLNTGEYGIFEGKQVPLDYPLLEDEVENPIDTLKIDIPLFIRLLEYAREDAKTDMDLHDLTEKALMASTEGKILTMDDYSFLVPGQEKIDEDELAGEEYAKYGKDNDISSYIPYGSLLAVVREEWGEDSDLYNALLGAYIEQPLNLNKVEKVLMNYDVYDDYMHLLRLNEAKDKKKHPPLNKPKRGGSKKFYVYVRDPKTKRIKKVSFGDTTGLKAKINNPKARRAFAKRQRCSDAKDKTKARYWACRLPRFAHLLGLKTTFSGYW